MWVSTSGDRRGGKESERGGGRGDDSRTVGVNVHLKTDTSPNAALNAKSEREAVRLGPFLRKNKDLGNRTLDCASSTITSYPGVASEMSVDHELTRDLLCIGNGAHLDDKLHHPRFHIQFPFPNYPTHCPRARCVELRHHLPGENKGRERDREEGGEGTQGV